MNQLGTEGIWESVIQGEESWEHIYTHADGTQKPVHSRGESMAL